MTDETIDESNHVGAAEYRPTLLDRFWRLLGYRGAYPEPPGDWDGYWGRTDVHVHLSWGDRLRLLVSGRALLRMEHDYEYDPGTIKNASAFQIQRPGSR